MYENAAWIPTHLNFPTNSYFFYNQFWWQIWLGNWRRFSDQLQLTKDSHNNVLIRYQKLVRESWNRKAWSQIRSSDIKYLSQLWRISKHTETLAPGNSNLHSCLYSGIPALLLVVKKFNLLIPLSLCLPQEKNHLISVLR